MLFVQSQMNIYHLFSFKNIETLTRIQNGLKYERKHIKNLNQIKENKIKKEIVSKCMTDEKQTN